VNPLADLIRGRSSLTCQELVELVTDYLEGTLTSRQSARFERHIAACPHCTAYLQQLRVTLEALGELHEDDVPAPVREDLLHAFRDWKTPESG
jgi:anti-sigma factor RsiW